MSGVRDYLPIPTPLANQIAHSTSVTINASHVVPPDPQVDEKDHKIISGRDVVHPIEIAVFGILFVLQVVYVLNAMLGDDLGEYFRYWSCWNYLANAVYYFFLLAGRNGALRTIAHIFTPYMLALNLLWAVLTTLIVIMGTITLSSGSLTLAEIERYAGLLYLHYCPLIVTAVVFFLRLGEIRAAFMRVAVLLFGKTHSWLKGLSMVVILGLPGLSFWIYTLIQDPYTVYGIEEPSRTMLIVISISVISGYCAVMAGILTLMYMKKDPRYIQKMEARRKIREISARNGTSTSVFSNIFPN